MALKSVLILTAGFGEGHNAAARNTAEALRARNPGARIEVHDVFLEAYGWVNLLVREAYLAAITHTPALWKLVFGLLDKTSVLGGGIGIFGRAARHLDGLIGGLSPEVIVSTYPGYGHLLDYLRRRGRTHEAKVVVLVTDSLSINSAWYRPPSDVLLVANRETADVIARAGVSSGKIRVTGFPVPAVFRQPIERADGPPWDVLYMVNSAHHVAPEIVRALLGVSGIRLTVTAGRDEKLAAAVRELSAKMGIPVSVFGWTSQIAELLRKSHILISKAGGATVQEALAARTPMIITQIVPGQEEGNATLMIECGAGEFVGTPGTIAAAVAGMTADGGALYRRRRDAAAAISRPDAAEAVAACIEEIIR